MSWTSQLLAEIVLALGGALAIGMGMALFGPALRERYGMAEPVPGREAPPGAGHRLAGAARIRAAFLLLVGVVMAVWALATLLSR
jgi:hypothetical protein